jgi:hypothetical protein
MAKEKFLRRKLRKPIYDKLSQASIKLISVLEYPSRFKANTAFGPTSRSPEIIRVKGIPKKGY